MRAHIVPVHYRSDAFVGQPVGAAVPHSCAPERALPHDASHVGAGPGLRRRTFPAPPPRVPPAGRTRPGPPRGSARPPAAIPSAAAPVSAATRAARSLRGVIDTPSHTTPSVHRPAARTATASAFTCRRSPRSLTPAAPATATSTRARNADCLRPQSQQRPSGATIPPQFSSATKSHIPLSSLAFHRRVRLSTTPSTAVDKSVNRRPFPWTLPCREWSPSFPHGILLPTDPTPRGRKGGVSPDHAGGGGPVPTYPGRPGAVLSPGRPGAFRKTSGSVVDPGVPRASSWCAAARRTRRWESEP